MTPTAATAAAAETATAAADLVRALAVLAEPPGPAHEAIAAALDLGAVPDRAAYTDVLALGVAPYAAVYLGPEGMLGGAAADRIAGFWRAVGQVPPAEPDHLSALLGLYAVLLESEDRQDDPARAAMRRRARSVLLWEHLLTWVPLFAQSVAAAGSPFYANWAALVVEVLLAEAAELGLPESASAALPVALREAPGLPDEVERARDLASDLLSPVRSGVVLSRRDLAQAARDLGLALRIGERSYVLAAMLEQDPVLTLEWVATRADVWASRHRALVEALGPVAEFWTDRAVTTAQTCRARHTELQEVRDHVQ